MEIRAVRNLNRNVNIKQKQKHIFSRPSRLRIVQYFAVIWLDSKGNGTDEDFQKLHQIANSAKRFHNTDECIDFLTDLNSGTVFMILSNDLSPYILPLIIDLPQLCGLYAIKDSRIQSKDWMQENQKLKGSFNGMDSICNVLKHDIRKREIDLAPISIIPNNSVVSFDELDQSFMYSQILKETIIEIDYKEKSKEDFVSFCREQYLNNDYPVDVVNQFDRDYKVHSPIWWYTKEPFIYATLNQALRKQDIEIIMKMGFFLQDLHRQIEQIYSETHLTIKMILYRGQGMASMEFEKLKLSKGGLLSFNSFLSTSVDRQVSFQYASSAQQDPDLVGTLFQMKVDPKVSSVPFAELNNIGFYSDLEKEILFSMHSVFRIGDIMQIEDRLWQINLILTGNDDPQLTNLKKYLRYEISDHSGWVKMAGLMFKMGKFEKAIELYDALLDAVMNDDQSELAASLPVVLINNAATHVSLGNYSTALKYYETTLTLMENSLLPNDPLLVTIYNNLGTAHRLSDDFPPAIAYYEKAMDIVQKFLPNDRAKLATTYQNMGDMHQQLGQYSTALTYHEKALHHDQAILPSIHPYLGTSYFKNGYLHELMGNYSDALRYYEEALKIEQKSLPTDHPDIASTYRIIGGIRQLMGEYVSALSYYEKTTRIEDKSLPSNHPNRANTLNDIGEVYRLLGDYPTALEYYGKSLEVRDASFSSDHHSLAATYNNIG